MAVVTARTADIPLILSLLRATPNPPLENESSIAAKIAAGPTSVDTVAPAICRMVKRSDEDVNDIPWWTWAGAGDIEAKLMPVFTHALSAFIVQHGRACLPWSISGNLSGSGADDAAKRTDADGRADAVKNFLQRDLPANSVLRVRALNGKDAFLQSTVTLMAKRAGIDVDALLL
jgi:hypothetical protein